MKIIQIRHSIDNAMYFAADGWNPNRKIAREFKTALEAIVFIIERQIIHAELVGHSLGAASTEIDTVVIEMNAAWISTPDQRSARGTISGA